MKNSFIKWYCKEGWKSYWFAYTLVSLFVFGTIFWWQDLMASPFAVKLCYIIATHGFAIGITYHMIDTYHRRNR